MTSERRPPDLPPGYFGPPYFEIHAEGWALVIIVLWLIVGGPLLWWFL